MKTTTLISLAITLTAVTAKADLNDIFFDRPFFHSTDSLAPRDEWDLLHQSRTTLYDTDFAPRHSCRWLYYLESGRSLSMNPAYVGALQRDLARLGYYCGPINGVFSDEVSDAIARLQKNYSQRVTGTLTVPVRRVLYLP
jgi:Putative peptidoglycan binding domain